MKRAPEVAVIYHKLWVVEMNCRHQSPKRIDQEGPAGPNKKNFNPTRMESSKCGAGHSRNHQRAKDVKHTTPENKASCENGQAKWEDDVANYDADFCD